MGLFFAEPVDDTWREELTWRAGPVRMRRGTQGHVAEPREPTRHRGGGRCAQGPRESTGTPGWRHVTGGLIGEGPTS